MEQLIEKGLWVWDRHPRDHVQGFYPYLNSEDRAGKGATIRFTEFLMSNKPEGYLKRDPLFTLEEAAVTQVSPLARLADLNSYDVVADS